MKGRCADENHARTRKTRFLYDWLSSYKKKPDAVALAATSGQTARRWRLDGGRGQFLFPVELILRLDLGEDRLHLLGQPVDLLAVNDQRRGEADHCAVGLLAQHAALGQRLAEAARAVGLDCGPMSGFDIAKVDAEFFPDGRFKTDFLCNLGYGDASKLFGRQKRLPFETACTML